MKNDVDYTQLLRPPSSLSKAGKASGALFLGQKLHYETMVENAKKKAEKGSVREETVVQNPYKPPKGMAPIAPIEDKGRDHAISSSPRVQLEWDFAQTSLLIPKHQDKSEEQQTSWDRLYEYSTGARFKKMSRAKDKQRQQAQEQEDSDEEGHVTKSAIIGGANSRSHVAVHRMSPCFGTVDRWKESPKFVAPPVGHYRPRYTVTESRPKSADFVMHPQTYSKLKSQVMDSTPQQQSDDEDDDGVPVGTNATDLAKESRAQNPATKSRRSHGNKSVIPDDPHDQEVAQLFMRLPKTNPCSSSFRSRQPQRPSSHRQTPDHYAPDDHIIHPRTPSFTIPVAGKDSGMIGRPTSAPPIDVIEVPHGSAYNINTSLVKPSITGFSDFKRQITREKWTKAKQTQETPSELNPTKPKGHVLIPDFDRMVSREAAPMMKDMVDRSIDPTLSYEYEASKDYIAPRVSTPDLSKSTSRKFQPPAAVDHVYDIHEDYLYHNRSLNVHEFGKAPGHK
eukprot:TRINITY_DN4418_c0_g1_i1.p1 TRINITY_DN4418_c0_g1~~TRINITY_DN4418_c0_g1_i1.p1  ORF type:complete len:507 (+),score=105.19 TRINITY_DN4418_c0_g1_i1:51-1571(+)